MLPRQLSSLIVAVSVLLLSAFAAQELRRPTPPPHTLGELRELLSRSPARLHVVAQAKNNVESGIYVCASGRAHEDLCNLIRAPEFASHWGGVAFCERIGTGSQIPGYFLESWGENGMELGGFHFFGDPAVLRQIEDALRHNQQK